MESNFKSLYYFVVTAEEMNFTRAANKIYITQQSLSNQIKKLEEQYGVLLFERRPALRLTVAGERLLNYARHAIQDEERLFNDLKRESAQGQVRMTVGIPAARCKSFLPDIFHNYREQHPEVIPSYMTYGYATADAMLREGKLDLYFAVMNDAGRAGRQLSVAPDKLYLVVNREMWIARHGAGWHEALLRASKGVTLAETLDYPMVLPYPASALRAMLDTQYDALGAIPNVVAEMVDSMVCFEMICRNDCASFFSKTTLYNLILDRMTTPLYAFPVLGLPDASFLGIVYPEDGAPQYVLDYVECARRVITETDARIDRFFDSFFTRIGD